MPIDIQLESAAWGEGVVKQLAEYLKTTQLALRRFTRANLFRIRQFYATYQDDEKVPPLATQLPWTHNLIILSQSKTPEEREFYLKTAIREKLSSYPHNLRLLSAGPRQFERIEQALEIGQICG